MILYILWILFFSSLEISAAVRLSALPELAPHPQIRVWNKRRGANLVIYGNFTRNALP